MLYPTKCLLSYYRRNAKILPAVVQVLLTDEMTVDLDVVGRYAACCVGGMGSSPQFRFLGLRLSVVVVERAHPHLVRLDLLEFFRRECEERGATIVYATHIFDGLEKWITHIAYLEGGKQLRGDLIARQRYLQKTWISSCNGT